MKKLFASVFALAIAMQASAQVQLNVDENIKVIAINGQEIKHGLLQPLQTQFQLEAGRHVITARYDRLFNLHNKDHDYLKSDTISLTVDLADNQQYQLIMPNQPNSYNAAKEYIKTPTLAVAQNGKIIAEQSKIDTRTGVLANVGSMFGGLFNRDQGAVLQNQQAYNDAQNTTQTQPATQTKGSLDNFMQLWLNANEEEREKIRQWVQK